MKLRLFFRSMTGIGSSGKQLTPQVRIIDFSSSTVVGLKEVNGTSPGKGDV